MATQPDPKPHITISPDDDGLIAHIVADDDHYPYPRSVGLTWREVDALYGALHAALQDHHYQQHPEQVPMGAPEKYPWGEWLNGKTWRLVQGIDYGGQTRGFILTARAAAKRRGLKLWTSLGFRNGSVFIRAWRP